MRIYQQPSEPQAIELLTASKLITSDLTPAHFEHFLGCTAATGDTADPLQGIVGIEMFPPNGLLRSLAVAPEARNTGCGKALVAEIESFAKARNIDNLFLLTTTAEKFFEHLGYMRVPSRSEVPLDIRQTKEFSSLCPDIATVMTKRLQ